MDDVDVAVFRELQESAGAEFVRELLATFAEEAPRMIATLRASLESGDANAFRRAAHSLKSNSQTFGAGALAAIARELELGAAAIVPGDRGAALGELDDHLRRAVERLRELANE